MCIFARMTSRYVQSSTKNCKQEAFFLRFIAARTSNTHHYRILLLECQEHARPEFRLQTSQKRSDKQRGGQQRILTLAFSRLSLNTPNLQQREFFFIAFPGRTRILARTPLFSRVCTTRSRNSVSSSIEMFPSIMITNKKMRRRTLKRCKYLRFPSRVYFFAGCDTA